MTCRWSEVEKQESREGADNRETYRHQDRAAVYGKGAHSWFIYHRGTQGGTFVTLS